MLNRGTFGVILALACLLGAFLTAVYTFRLFFIVFTGEPSDEAREHFHAHGKSEGPFSMVWTVTALAALSVVGGFLQFSPGWHPLTNWLEFVAPSLDATNTQEFVASFLAVLFGFAGIFVAWRFYSAKAWKVPPTMPLLAHKFYFDEIYDLLFYKPAVVIAWAFHRFIERPLIAGSIGQVAGGFGFGSRELGRVQNGLVRSYALALASGLAVLAVVFLVQR